MNNNLTHYVKKFSGLLLSTKATNQHGEDVSLDEGGKRAAEMILSVRSASHKVMLIGNGGSAAIATHMQNDLCKTVGVRAIVFTEPPLLTAITNDDGYEHAFEHLVKLWADSNDLLIAISSSGRSENILRAVHAATARECHIITLSGFDADNPLRRTGHLNFYIPSLRYGYVELVHSIVAHFLTDTAKELARI